MSNDQPPHISPDGKWYWDGTAWKPMPQQPAPPPVGYQPPQPQVAGQTGRQPFGAQPTPSSSVGKKILQWGGGGVALLLALSMCGAIVGGGDSTDPSDTTAAALAEPADDDGSEEAGGPPADQRAWLAAVAAGQDAADGANELQVVQARKERGDAMCEAISRSLSVSNWVGEVDDIKTTLGGDGGVLELVVAKDVKVATWNNGVSDVMANTIIDPDSELWNQIVDLQEGDTVYFSGRFDDGDDCITESSVVDENGMRTPTFIFKFAAVGLVDDGPLDEATAAAPPKTNDDATEPAAEEESATDEAPAAAPIGIEGDGTWMVPAEVKPGTYVGEGGDFCTWERLKGTSGRFKDIIANGISARPVVEVKAGDKAFGTDGCGTWTKVAAYTGTKAKKIPGDGEWIVGNDIVPGTYRSDGGDFCTWERLRNFGGNFNGIIANGIDKRPLVTIQPGDKGFGTDGCGTWSKIG